MSEGSIIWRRSVFFDSSAFLPLVNSQDVSHQLTIRILDSITRQRRPRVTSNFVVAEAHALILRRLGRDIGWRFLQTTQHAQMNVVRIESADEERAVEIIERYADKAFSYTDAPALR